MDGRGLVAEVRAAAARHDSCWKALVPNRFVVDQSAEAAEDVAFQEMAQAKERLRDHICATYGITIRELSSLTLV